MLFVTIAAFFGALFLSLFSAASRKASFVSPSFFYLGFQRLFFQKKEAERIYAAVRITRVLLLVLFIVLLSTYATSLSSFVVLAVFSWLALDVLPSIIAYRHFEKFFVISAPVVSFYLILFSPVHFMITGLSKRFLDALAYPLMKQNSAGMTEKVLAILEDSESKGSHDKELIHAVIKFKDRIVREVMVPRVHLMALPVKTTVFTATKQLLEEGYSRVPVYKDNIDEILGILMHKDILKLYGEAKTQSDLDRLHQMPLDTLVKPILFTPETKKVALLLQDFRSKQMHMAVVVDEYGGTAGLVTIEDLLEEIVGEIADEYDKEQDKLYSEETAGSFLVDPRMSILDIDEQCGIKIPQEGDYDTIGGYIYHRAGAIPKKGFHISHDTFDLEVLNATERSILQVRLTKRDNEEDEE
jgi:putative hemolysin